MEIRVSISVHIVFMSAKILKLLTRTRKIDTFLTLDVTRYRQKHEICALNICPYKLDNGTK